MASTYKLKRKSKEDAKTKPDQNTEDFSALLLENSAPTPHAVSEDPASEKESTAVFDPISSDGKKMSKDELLDALQTKKVDAKKVDEVFFHPKGALSSDTTKEEFDETAHLLKELFGSSAPEKKKAAAPIIEQAEKGEEPKSEAPSEEYVAIHVGEEEATKEYPDTSTLKETLASISEQMEENTKVDLPTLKEEMNVSDSALADDPYSDTYEELEKVSQRKAVLPEEFTSYEEYDEFAEHLRNRNFRSLCFTLWTFLSFLALFYLESATFTTKIFHPVFLRPGGIYNIIYLLVDLQLVLVSAVLVLPSVIDGIKTLIRGKPSRNSAVFVIHLFCILHPVTLLLFGGREYPLFGSLAALFSFLCATANFLDSKRIYRTFRVCCKKGEKLVAKKAEKGSAEHEAFGDQLGEEPTFFSIQKAGFIDGFFARLQEKSKSESSFGIALLVSLLASAAFAGFSFWKGAAIDGVATSFMQMLAMTLPLSSLYMITLPFSHLSVKAEKKNAAIISAAAADEYAAASAVSFTDKEIFPPRSVKVTTIRTYGQTRIDEAILYAAMIFQKLGGPLSEVFKKTISGIYHHISEDFDFREITSDGMCAKINGKDVFVGNKDYLLSYDFGYTKDEIDEPFETKHGKIMYMVIGSELAAKFYIRYSISKQFKKTVLALYKAGICPAVKTCDPNIDSALFRTLLKNSKIPAGIIKTCEAMKDAPVEEKSESGVVCSSSIANLLQTFNLCDSLRHLKGANVIMMLLSLLLGAGIIVFLFAIQNMARVTGLFALIYQILWLIPIVIPSLSE